mmetsp:Transcript_17016/g.46632  ORF Transcript_17016/g.46632 Transcript_17016/m.46632 type:complete len:331 (+) Transcript_17016:257-1249(+)
MVSTIRLNQAAALAALLFASARAFVVPTSRQHNMRTTTTSLAMSSQKEKDTEDPTLMKSVLNKQIAYDEKTGRFFESTIDEDDCVPEDEFCVTDKETGDLVRLTLEEKERIFTDAMQAYYSSGRKLLEDDEFDLLKEDLTWNGSPVVVMNRKESAYMKAMQDYLKGTPSMGDSEFDSLKRELQEDGSVFAVQTEPKCYIDTGICKVTMTNDFFKNNLLYLPAGVAIATLWLGVTYELIEPIIRVNPLFLLLAGSPVIYSGSRGLTENFVFENAKIVRGPCPACNYENTVYFGNILGVEGFDDIAQVKCPNCKEQITVQRNTLRASTIPKA